MSEASAPRPAAVDTDPAAAIVATRPAAASRKARRPKEARKVTRYTLDLEQQQHMHLRLFALQHGVEASRICRTLLYLLESDPKIAERVLDELFADDEDTTEG